MSEEHPYRVEVAPDALPRRPLTLVIVAGVLTIVASLVAVRWWMGPALPVDSTIHGPAPREISRIEQTLIDVDDAGARQRREGTERLSRYEWVDRDKGVVRIPLERAYDVVSGGGR